MRKVFYVFLVSLVMCAFPLVAFANDVAENSEQLYILVKGRTSLAERVAVTPQMLEAGEIPVTLSRFGDANGDNEIDIRDFRILSASFNTEYPDPRYDPRADFNNDGIVDIRDFRLLSGSFNTIGEQLPPGYSWTD
jgi:hypothetical protein